MHWRICVDGRDGGCCDWAWAWVVLVVGMVMRMVRGERWVDGSVLRCGCRYGGR